MVPIILSALAFRDLGRNSAVREGQYLSAGLISLIAGCLLRDENASFARAVYAVACGGSHGSRHSVLARNSYGSWSGACSPITAIVKLTQPSRPFAQWPMSQYTFAYCCMRLLRWLLHACLSYHTRHAAVRGFVFLCHNRSVETALPQAIQPSSLMGR